MLSSRQSSEIALSEFPEKHKAEMASQISQQYACECPFLCSIAAPQHITREGITVIMVLEQTFLACIGLLSAICMG